MRESWKVSLHGGHSGQFCEHAVGSLADVVEAAVAAGYDVFGVSEHAPRAEERFLYPSEREKGYTLERLEAEFQGYAAEIARLRDEFEPRLTVLCGFEAEVVPAADYPERMRELRERYGLDYMVGSVHYVHEIQIDGTPEEYAQAVESAGGLEALAVAYYDQVAEMAEKLRPEVVGHLDLIVKNAPRDVDMTTAPIRAGAERALESIRAVGAVLDLNTAGRRKGLPNPYPAPWLVHRAREMDVDFCFGDDSHGPEQVGMLLDDARQYLIENGVTAIRGLMRRDGTVVSETRSLV